MWSMMEAEGTLYSKCINGKEPLWEGSREGGVGVGGVLGRAEEHIIPPIVGVNYTKIHKTYHS